MRSNVKHDVLHQLSFQVIGSSRGSLLSPLNAHVNIEAEWRVVLTHYTAHHFKRDREEKKGKGEKEGGVFLSFLCLSFLS